jgi:hypothetical protein
MILIVAFLVALVSLLGVASVVINHLLFTVDGLFMSLVLLSISGISGTTGLYELRKRSQPSSSKGGGAPGSRGSGPGGTVQKGRVESVEFFESNVGQPNKSVVTLVDGAKPAVTMVFEGDLRNALPVGQKVAVTVRKQPGYNVLVSVSNA